MKLSLFLLSSLLVFGTTILAAPASTGDGGDAALIPPECRKRCHEICLPIEATVEPPKCRERCELKCTRGELDETTEQEIELPPRCRRHCAFRCLSGHSLQKEGDVFSPPQCHKNCSILCPLGHEDIQAAVNATEHSDDNGDLTLPPKCHRKCERKCSLSVGNEPFCHQVCHVDCPHPEEESNDDKEKSDEHKDDDGNQHVVIPQCRRKCQELCTGMSPFLVPKCHEKCQLQCTPKSGEQDEHDAMTESEHEMELPPKCRHHCQFKCTGGHISSDGHYVRPKCSKRCGLRCAPGHESFELADQSMLETEGENYVLPPNCEHHCNFRCLPTLMEGEDYMHPRCHRHCRVDCKQTSMLLPPHTGSSTQNVTFDWPPYAEFEKLPKEKKSQLDVEDKKVIKHLERAFHRQKPSKQACNIEKHVFCFAKCLDKKCLFGRCAEEGVCSCKLCL